MADSANESPRRSQEELSGQANDLSPSTYASPESVSSPEHDEGKEHARERQENDNSPNRMAESSGYRSSPEKHSQSRRIESQLSRRSQKRSHTPIAAVSYPPRVDGLTVADFLDPSQPLVKSSIPLTKPKGPSFVEDTTAKERKQRHAEKKMHSAITSAQINSQRMNERKFLKAQYEFEREKLLAERSIYHKERTHQWSQRLSASPLGVDLVADHERIDEENYIREREELRRRAAAERKKQRIKRAIIVKALSEVPLLEKARKEKRALVEGEKREKALRDVQRVEAIQERKIKDQDLMAKERQAKLDQRIMTSAKH